MSTKEFNLKSGLKSDLKFDLRFFGWPTRQSRDFLSTESVAHQLIPAEIEKELRFIEDPKMIVPPKTSLWKSFILSCPRLFFESLKFNFLSKFVFLGGLMLSEQLLTPGHSLSLALMVVAVFAAFKGLSLVVNYFSMLNTDRISVALGVFLIARINKKLLSVDRFSLDGANYSSGTLKVLVASDIQLIQRFFSGFWANIVPTVLTLVILGPLLVYRMGWAGFLSLAFSFSLIPISLYLAKYIGSFQEKIQKKEDGIASLVGEWVRNIRLVRFLSLGRPIKDRLNQAATGLIKELSAQHVITIINDSLTVVWWMLPIIFLCLLTELMGTSYSIATLFGSIWILNELNSGIKYIPFSIRDYAAASASINRIQKFWNLPDFTDRLLPPLNIDERDFEPKKILFRGVSLGYGDTDLFSDLSLEIFLNQKTGIVGPVGAGKSLILKAIVGEVAPRKGEIFVEMGNGDRYNLWHEDIHSLFRSFVGYVPQTAYLSNDGLVNNISLDTEVDSKRLMDAIHRSQLISDIETFEHGMKEEIGEYGVNLSGGQKQRLSIARAFYFERGYSILDDPLSALDTSTEDRFFETFLQRCPAFLFTTHRLSRIESVDRVLILGEGIVIEDGSPDQLLSRKGSEFSKLVEESAKVVGAHSKDRGH